LHGIGIVTCVWLCPEADVGCHTPQSILQSSLHYWDAPRRLKLNPARLNITLPVEISTMPQSLSTVHHNNKSPFIAIAVSHTANIGLQQAVTQDSNGTAQTGSVCNKLDHTVSPATHTRTFPCLYSQPQDITAFGWYSLRLPTKGWPG